jgi:uncharacterized protein (TIGR02611 family)
VVISVVGTTVLLIGVALLVLPGPAFVVIPVGLAILATEFAWARRWLRFVRESAEKGVDMLNLRNLRPFSFWKKNDRNRQDTQTEKD